MLLARRSLAALAARRATSTRPVGRAVLPQTAQHLQQNLIGGVNASATTSATGLSLNHLIVESNAADSLQAPVNDVLAWTPLETLPVSAATLPEWRVVLDEAATGVMPAAPKYGANFFASTLRVEALQPTTAIEADTAILTPQFLGLDVLNEAPAPKYSLEPLVEACGLSKPWSRDDNATASDLLVFSANAGTAMAALDAMNDDDDEHQDLVKAQIQSLIDQAKTVAEQGLTDPLRKEICDGLAATLGLLGLGDEAQNQGRVLRLRLIPSCGNL